MSTILKIYNLLNKNHKIYFFFLISLSFVSLALELIGIGSIIPFVYLILSDEANIYIDFISDIFYNPGKNELVVYSMLIILSVFIFKNIFGILLSYLQVRFGMRVQIDFAKRLIAKYLQSNYEYHLRKNSSELLNNIDRQINQCVLAVKILMNLITEIIIILGITVLLFFVNFLSTFVILIVGLLSSIIFYFSFSKNLKLYGENLIQFEGLKLKNILQGFQGIKEIKIYNKSKHFLEKFLNSNDSSEFVKSNYLFLQSLPKQFYEIFAVLSFVSIGIFIFIFTNDPVELFATISIYGVAGIRLLPSANKILTSMQQIRFSFKGVQIISSELEQEYSLDLLLNNRNDHFDETFNFNNAIRIDNLGFSYFNTNNKVLDNINFTIKKGEIIKINGDSGSGKSTLVNLLTGLLEPTEGNISVDGHNILSFIKEWRNMIGYVPQSVYLLDDTIRRNIAFGIADELISDERIHEVIDEAQLGDLINSLQEGINTYVGEKGTRISGGQLQRIGIARALYNKPKLIIFDEATNSLDPENEDKIINLIKSYTDITIIFISHNRELLKESNKVLDL